MCNKLTVRAGGARFIREADWTDPSDPVFADARATESSEIAAAITPYYFSPKASDEVAAATCLHNVRTTPAPVSAGHAARTSQGSAAPVLPRRMHTRAEARRWPAAAQGSQCRLASPTRGRGCELPLCFSWYVPARERMVETV